VVGAVIVSVCLIALQISLSKKKNPKGGWLFFSYKKRKR
jgi:hypothetical protein